ncbi:hypothetical protein GQ607_016126 [Colletotrichum asianum]|uniref:Uncharacterized protein n=1 Tax=Colletotrichum asianum TaxID=702518 RepID=A0A8H3VXA8_9PEZI|nr:hypothetical protein GQ607_016126 [Colletotrichum asianum]
MEGGRVKGVAGMDHSGPLLLQRQDKEPCRGCVDTFLSLEVDAGILANGSAVQEAVNSCLPSAWRSVTENDCLGRSGQGRDERAGVQRDGACRIRADWSFINYNDDWPWGCLSSYQRRKPEGWMYTNLVRSGRTRLNGDPGTQCGMGECFVSPDAWDA